MFWSEANKLIKCTFVLGSQEYNSCEILPLGQGETYSEKKEAGMSQELVCYVKEAKVFYI